MKFIFLYLILIINSYGSLYFVNSNIEIPKKLYTTKSFINSNSNTLNKNFIFGIQNSEILLLDDKKDQSTVDLKSIPFKKNKKSIQIKALSLQKKLNNSIYKKNIFPQGTLPDFINFLPNNFRITRSCKNNIKIEKGEIVFPEAKWNVFCKISSPILIDGPNKNYFIIIKYKAKGFHPKNPPIRPNNQITPLLKYRNNNSEWNTQIDIWRINSKLIDLQLINRRIKSEYRIKELGIYIIE